MKASITSLYNWYRDTLRNPKYRWWIVLGTLAYLVSPFDISPDFIPIGGQIDDFMIVTLLVTELSQVILDGFKARRQSKSVDVNLDSEDVKTVEVEVETI
ncbi:MAG: YkvA family protein [Cyanobacteria bacterium P01_F01_bin.143]